MIIQVAVQHSSPARHAHHDHPGATSRTGTVVPARSWTGEAPARDVPGSALWAWSTPPPARPTRARTTPRSRPDSRHHRPTPGLSLPAGSEAHRGRVPERFRQRRRPGQGARAVRGVAYRTEQSCRSLTISQASSRTRTTMPQRSRARTRPRFVGSVICPASCVDRAAEEGDQPLDGRGMSGGDLGRAEATGAGFLGQLGSGERQRLFG
jgi:hypothetical protein